MVRGVMCRYASAFRCKNTRRLPSAFALPEIVTCAQRCLACSPRKTKQIEFALATCLPSWSATSHST
jgi:hypothetical protein